MSTLLVICICGASLAGAFRIYDLQVAEESSEGLRGECDDRAESRSSGPLYGCRSRLLHTAERTRGGADPAGDDASYSACTPHGTVVCNGDGTFIYAQTDGTHAQTDVVSIVTDEHCTDAAGDTVIEIEMRVPDIALDPDAAIAGPFGILDHPMLGLHHREHLFCYRVPTDRPPGECGDPRRTERNRWWFRVVRGSPGPQDHRLRRARSR